MSEHSRLDHKDGQINRKSRTSSRSKNAAAQQAKQLNWQRICAAPLLAVIHLWRYLFSPLLPHSCRFSPSCSEYAIEAVRCHGTWRGGILLSKRLLRCHPFYKRWGYDPVPKHSATCSSHQKPQDVAAIKEISS